jgi:chromate reductase, NAD(P)H dehydrogenase (quinone)
MNDDKIHVLGIAGSLRRGSFNRAALHAAVALAPPGMTIEPYDIAAIPLYDQDHEKPGPAAVQDFKSRIRAADAILFATPEYNYSIPGVLKNAIDCASRPHGDNAWDGKPAAILSASVGAFGGARAQYHLRQCFVYLNMYAVNQPEVMIPNGATSFDASGQLTDETSRKLIRALLESLGTLTRTMLQGRAALAPG